ncbi:hypothetical protein [Actinoplanes couchii]|uniref:CopG domain protein DNA-binding domain protein n=1 Tax=Actinoplanes couchii TaxID=403638 RepID=A0ABQ3XJC6_9ACTN|nr:hypothetical protein [Actinoplanes couchii]MDR6324392.1 hypothetical protein [Actinoplanes couchii]GID58607.1 hypothetical protein Aco03nite_070110 [Actinoplanes couchii]
MARTIIVIEIDESRYRDVESAAREMDISPETFVAVVTEQYVTRQIRQRATPEPPIPSEPTEPNQPAQPSEPGEPGE